MLAGNSFQLRSGDDLELTWEYDVTGHTPELMLLSRTQVLLWLVDSAEIVALNGETGELQWGPVAIPALLDRIGDEDDREAQRHEAERDFLKMTDNRPLRPELRRRILGGRGDAQANEEEAGNWPDTLPGRLVIKQVNDAVICVGDPLGRVAAINRRTGELLWDRLTPMDELDWIALSDEAVALAGKEGLKTDAPAGQILVLDPITGEERIADIHETSVLRWVGMDDEGMLVYATRDQLVAHQIGSGEAWRLAPQNADMADRGWIGLGVVMITAMLDEQQTNLALLIVDSNTGALLSNWTLVTPLDQQSPTMLEPADRNWHVIQRHRASAFGPQGKLQWADAINEPGKQLMMQLLGDRISVLLSSNRLADMQNRVGDAVRLGEPVDPRTMQIYMLDIESGALIAQRQLGPVPDPIDTSRALLLDNRLVLATLSEIVVIKGSADPPADLDRAPAGQKLN